MNKSQISSIDFVILRVAVYANTSTTAFHKTTHVVIVTHFARYRRSLRNHLNCSCARAVARLVRCHAAAAGQSHSLLYSTTVIIRADEVVRRRGYSDHSVTMCVCVWVCYHDKTKDPDRNDLKLGIVVVLDVCRGLWILSSKGQEPRAQDR